MVSQRYTRGSAARKSTASSDLPPSGVMQLFMLWSDRFFERDDMTAVENGWEVRRTRGGLRHSYRDSRWNRARSTR